MNQVLEKKPFIYNVFVRIVYRGSWRYKLSLVTFLVIVSISLVLYFHLYLQRGTVFTQFFYIPIILSSLWWGKRGMVTAIFLSLFLVLSHLIFRTVDTYNDYYRSIMLLLVAFVVSFLREREFLLERKITIASEFERQRIGRDLHDLIGQDLTAIGFLIKTIKKNYNLEDVDIMNEASYLVQKAIVHTRGLSKVLSPIDLDRVGFLTAIEDFIDHLNKLSEVRCSMHVEGACVTDSSHEMLQLYYIVREALMNALKHGNAQNIDVYLVFKKNNISITIKDDGTGIVDINNFSNGLGFDIMQYRAHKIGADLYYGNRSQGGFRVKIEVRTKKWLIVK